MIYHRLRVLRKEKGISQSEIAQLLNCSQRVYSDYETGRLDIPTEILIALSKLHNVSTDYILNLTDDKNNP